MRKMYDYFLLLVFSPFAFWQRKVETALSRWRMRRRRQRTRAVTVMMLVMAMLTGLVGLPERTEAATGYTWKVINPGAKQEVVYIGKGRWDDQYYKLLTIKETIAQGATDAFQICDIAGEHYVALIPREAYKDNFYQPINVTEEVEEDGEKYVVDSTGARLQLSSKVVTVANTCSGVFSKEPYSDKKTAQTLVNGRTGLVKRPKKATLNAMVKGCGDERHFIGVSAWKDEGLEGGVNESHEDMLIPIDAGFEYHIAARPINDSKINAAKGVRLKFSKFPSSLKKGEIFKLTATITSSNASNSPVKDTIEFVAKSDVKINVRWSDTEYRWPEVGRQPSRYPELASDAKVEKKFMKALFSKSGALIGNTINGLNYIYDGVIPYSDFPCSYEFKIDVKKLK